VVSLPETQADPGFCPSYFKTHLKEVVHGSSAFEFIGATRQKPRPPDKAVGDPSWLRGARFPKPDAVPHRRNKKG